MKLIATVTCVVLCIAASAHAGAVLHVDAVTPPDQPGGMYSPGSIVDFAVSISADWPEDIWVGGIALDFQASSPGLILQGPGGDPDFAFDFSSVGGGAMYMTFPAYLKPSTTFTGTSGPVPGSTLLIPRNGTLTIGAGQVQLPITEGTFTVDAVSAARAGGDDGAMLMVFFTDPPVWTVGNGQLSGVPAVLQVVPEPVTALLLAVGAVACARRRRESNRLR